jgi:sterol desaturase/sphingolipid hydroxylase (fatty acid hydroxylase superfamily)
MRNWLLRNRAFLVFIPIVGASLWLAYPTMPSATFLGWLCGGLLAWTLMEWLAHRAMHLKLRSQWLSRIQDEAHLRHHREPDDLEHSVLRLRASLPISAFILIAARVVAGGWPAAITWTAGVLIGYMLYEFVHLTSHGQPRSPVLRKLHSYHLRHHFQQSDRGFGVTSPLWDWVFGTMPARRETYESGTAETVRIR